MLPGEAGLGRQQEATRWLEARNRIAGWADALAIPLPRDFDVACAHIAAIYADPGPYLAFSHGDPAPTNNHIGPARVRLVDFEYAGYRHALYDLTGWAILCPLPWAWVAAMEREFRRVLGAGAWGGTLTDEGRYQEAWATMCAYRALALITWLSPDLLAEDGAWAPGWTRRAALISTTLRLHQASTRVAALAPLSELGGRMSEELRARWPALGDGAPRWPAAVTKPG
jgi:Phosphotransferase enzyme family